MLDGRVHTKVTSKKSFKIYSMANCTAEGITAVVGELNALENYEVKQDFIKKFIKKDIKTKFFFKKIRGRNYFNLNEYIANQLISLGVKKIEVINKDTFNIKNNFFSARRSISLMRMIMVEIFL